MKNKPEGKSNALGQYRKYNIPVWEHPQFLFAVMGAIIMAFIVIAYLVGSRYLIDPKIVVILIFLTTVTLFIVSFAITRSFERMAEANRIKNELIGIVSHQIRTPLANLKWTHDSLNHDQESLTRSQQGGFFMMKEDINRMIKITDNLLMISRIERKKLSISRKPFSLKGLVSEIIEEKKRTVKDFENIELSFVASGDLPQITSDPDQIRWVIERFIDNAVKYISYNKKKKKIEIVIKKGKGKEIYFEIADNGTGIPKEDQKHIFKEFFRGRNAFKYDPQGTGLSLFICKAIIDKLGGMIGFKSREEAGSSFWITLPH